MGNAHQAMLVPKRAEDTFAAKSRLTEHWDPPAAAWIDKESWWDKSPEQLPFPAMFVQDFSHPRENHIDINYKCPAC